MISLNAQPCFGKPAEQSLDFSDTMQKLTWHDRRHASWLLVETALATVCASTTGYAVQLKLLMATMTTHERHCKTGWKLLVVPLKVTIYWGLYLHTCLQQAVPDELAQVRPIHGLARLARNDLACIKLSRSQILPQALHSCLTSICACKDFCRCTLDTQLWAHISCICGMC